MFYANHKKIHIGDIVYLQTEKLNGEIKDIISTHEKKIEWGIDDFGVMIECDVFGLLFLPEDLLSTVILCNSNLQSARNMFQMMLKNGKMKKPLHNPIEN